MDLALKHFMSESVKILVFYYHKNYKVGALLPRDGKLGPETWLKGIDNNIQLWHRTHPSERDNDFALQNIAASISFKTDIIKRDYC